MLDDDSNIKLIDFGLVADPDVCSIIIPYFQFTNFIPFLFRQLKICWKHVVVHPLMLLLVCICVYVCMYVCTYAYNMYVCMCSKCLEVLCAYGRIDQRWSLYWDQS